MTRIAIVTGASSGLGREFVKNIDARTELDLDELWVIARRPERLEALARTCRTPVKPLCLDLCDPASFDIVEAALLNTVEPEVALLVNNAGFGTFGDFGENPPGEGAAMIRLLCLAPIELIYRTLPHMASGSRIINVSSVAAFTPQPRLAVYSAAKRFILDVTRSLDVELEGTGIHATAVCPKFMKTEFLDAPGDRAAAGKMTAIGYERPEHVAKTALRASRAGRDLCIPSLDMKAYYALTKVLPYRAVIAAERALGIID